MKPKFITLLLGILLGLPAWLPAQDVEFSQFYAAPQYLNPAYAGTSLMPRFHLNFRDQYPAISHAYISYAAGYDQYIEALHGGIGVLVTGDQAGNGMYRSNAIATTYAYRLDISENFALHAALQGAFVQKGLDWNKLFFYDQIDPVTGFYSSGSIPNPTGEQTAFNPSVIYADFSAGFVAFTRNAYAGLSVKHLTRPLENFSIDYSARLPVRYTVHAGASIPLQEDAVTFSPAILYTRQAAFQQIIGGASLKYSSVFAGAWFRYNFKQADALIFLAGIEYGIFRFGYSYDLTLSDLRGRSGGAHEISMIFTLDNLPNAPKRNAGKYLQCPSMF